MDASWQPDPSGRHQYRWWDGAGWTDSVADNGQASTDALTGPAPATVIAAPIPVPVAPSATVPTWSVPPGTAAGATVPNYAAPPPLVKKGGKGKWIALSLVVLAAVGVGLFLILGKDSGSSSGGKSSLTFTKDKQVLTRTIMVKKGELYRIRVEPPRGVDTQSGLLISKTDSRVEAKGAISFYTDLYTDSNINAYISDTFSDATNLFTDASLPDTLNVQRGRRLDHDGGDGTPDSGGIVGVADVTYTLVITPRVSGETGTVKVFVEKYHGKSFTDASGLYKVGKNDPFFSDNAFFSDSSPYTGS